MPKAKFVRGGRGVFTCHCCGRRTRLVNQPWDAETCTECDELAMQDNSVNDGAQTWEETRPYCDSLLADLVKKGGDATKAKASFDYLWPETKAGAA